MSIKPFDRYGPRANPADGNYPNGSFKNESIPGADDGTPLEVATINDLQGFTDALLSEAGVAADGNPDTVLASQRLESIKKITKQNASNVTDMLSRTNLFDGQKFTTGSTSWKIVTSTKGIPTSTVGLYALPLNGVSLVDLGGDPINGGDSSDAIELAMSLYNIDIGRKFSLVLHGGDFNVSRPIRLSAVCSGMTISGGSGTITATEDMDNVISWPHLSDVTVKDIRFKLAAGVIITKAVVDGGLDGASAAKSIRTKLNNLSAFEISNAPIFIQLTQEWEFKLTNIRSDHDVSGQTGTNINLRACVNGQVKTPEIGYSAVGIKFSSSPYVPYKCEGIDLIAPVTTFATIGLKGDNITALKVTGGVLDFCLTRAWEFTNGIDVTFNGTWFANRADSGSSGTIGISQPSFSQIKLIGTHFVNNHPTNSWNALSLNSSKCKAYGNTSTGQFSTGLILSDASYAGNDFIDSSRGIATTETQTATAGAGNAAVKIIESGETQNSADRFLSRFEFSAPQINAASKFQIDVHRGANADQIYSQLAWNGVPKIQFDMTAGDIRMLADGRGLILTSPDGLITKLMRLSNAGAIELI